MPIELTVEQRDLQAALTDAWSDHAPAHDLWPSIRELGLTEIPFPEELGGAGYGLKDASVVMVAHGRCLGASPYLSSVIMAGLTLLHAADEEGRRAHLPAIVSGDRRAALVCGSAIGSSSIDAELTEAGTLLLNGRQNVVLDAASADVLVVVAHTASGVELGVVDSGAAGVSREVRESLDLTREFASVEFAGAEAVRVSDSRLEDRLGRVRSLLMIALAAEQVGIARQCLEMTVDYAKTRQQFGRTIGSFQALKHRLVDMLVATELAEATVLAAADADRFDDAELAERAASARVLASRAAMFAAEEAIQIHGGIGFTFEHPLHHHFRRAKTDQLLFQDTEVHVDAVARAVTGRVTTP
ncbi:acyl-CoA dehydrogenase family protein [Gordonia sp. NPDC058843]|uniref:acyl-CoA dehydrogenase family protein n=1 Tax=Gordonia sp. NPDC058843 TaxID=3346648 RepID=UPI0036CEAFB0